MDLVDILNAAVDAVQAEFHNEGGMGHKAIALVNNHRLQGGGIDITD